MFFYRLFEEMRDIIFFFTFYMNNVTFFDSTDDGTTVQNILLIKNHRNKEIWHYCSTSLFINSILLHSSIDTQNVMVCGSGTFPFHTLYAHFTGKKAIEVKN